jgi:hypothetical protein
MAIFRVTFSSAPKAAPIAVVPGPCGRAGLPVRKMITPEPCFTMRRAAAVAVLKFDLNTASTATMNRSVERSTDDLPLPYSVMRGPVALNAMSRERPVYDRSKVLVHRSSIERVDHGLTGSYPCSRPCDARRRPRLGPLS